MANCIEVSSDNLEILQNEEEVFAGWSESSIEKLESLPAIQFQKRIIPVHEIYTHPKTPR